MLKKLSIICLGIFIPYIIAKGQVTIGMDKPANSGALLDLKQEDTPGANSSKGLLLPRVNLESVNNLYPMFSKGYDKNTKDLTHIGLTVYNINNCFSEGVGPYAWDGNKWNLLIQRDQSEILSFEDQDGNTFFARRFGDAGIWMTQNLAAKKYDPIRDKEGETLYTNFKIRYPNNDSQLVADHPWMGVFYDFKTTTNNASKDEMDKTQIQGVCPHGWHVPSTYEWYDLETEIIKYTDKYTTLDYAYTDKGITQPSLSIGGNQQYGDLFRPGLVDPCPMPGRKDIINGVSQKAFQGGFAVRMVGVMKMGTNNEFNAVDGYGTKAGFWVAYTASGINGRNRVFLNTSIHNNDGGMDRYYSVRCKKNEE